jgi:GTP cyclohydrolase FolE2
LTHEELYMNNYSGLERSFQRVATWQRQFGHPGPEPALHHIVEEITKELLPHNPRDPEELADIFILWVGAVDNSDLHLSDIVAAIDKKMDKNVKRTWHPPDENGVVRHASEGVPA